MGRRVDVDPGGNLHFIANRDAIAIEEDTVIVYERAVADGDVWLIGWSASPGSTKLR